MRGITVIDGCVRTSDVPSSASSNSGPPLASTLSEEIARRETVVADGVVWEVTRFECKTFSRTVRDARPGEPEVGGHGRGRRGRDRDDGRSS